MAQQASSSGGALQLQFEVQGGGSISTGSGQIIATQISQILRAIEASAAGKLKIDVDREYLQKQISSAMSSSGISARGSGGIGSGKSGSSTTVDSGAAQLRETNALIKEREALLKQVYAAQTRTKSISGDASGFSTSEDSGYKNLVQQYNNVNAAYERMISTSERAKLSKQQQIELDNMIVQSDNRTAISQESSQRRAASAWDGLTDKIKTFISQVEKTASRSEEAMRMIDELNTISNSGDFSNFDEANEKLRTTSKFIHENNLDKPNFLQKGIQAFGTSLRSIVSSAIIMKITQGLRNTLQAIVEINTAMTKLRIVTNETEQTYKKLTRSVISSARAIGASVSEMIDSVTTYAKLGFSLSEATKLAEVTTAFSKVSDVSVDDTTRNITGIVKGYKVSTDELESVADKLVYVGNNFAISQAEIGEGMNNAASSLAANGNSLNQALGLLTAANTTVQDISRASTALRTITARLAASKADLESFGGDTEGVSTVANLSEKMGAYGIQITDVNGELRSTYDIIRDIATKWNDLQTTERSAIAGLAAGKLVPVYVVIHTLNTFNCR